MDEKDKAERRKGIGGSDVAPILGLSPWKKPIDVWLDKKGLVDELPTGNRAFIMQLGLDLEPVISKLYKRQTGKRLILPFPIRWQHKQHPLLLATPDRFVEGESMGVELKSESAYSDKFGDPGTDEVPPYYLLQVAHYMHVLDYETWDIAVLHGGARFAIYTVKRDRELEQAVTEQVLAWWERHMIKDTPPEVDGSEGWSKYLKKRFPENTGAMVPADEHTSQLIDLLLIMREGRDKYAAHVDEIENRLKMVIGENDGLTGEFGKVTWRKTKDREEIDWELAYKDFLGLVRSHLSPELLEQSKAIQSIHTLSRQGVRRFLLTEDKEHYGNRHRETGNLPELARAIQEGDRPRLAAPSQPGEDGPDRLDLLP